MRDRRAALLGAAFSAVAVSAWLGFERANAWALDHRAEHVRHSMRVLHENAAEADVVYVSNGLSMATENCTFLATENCTR